MRKAEVFATRSRPRLREKYSTQTHNVLRIANCANFALLLPLYLSAQACKGLVTLQFVVFVFENQGNRFLPLVPLVSLEPRLQPGLTFC